MNTQLTANYTEAELFYRYLGEQISNGGREASLKELLNGYVEYRRQLEDLRGKVREAEASSARGRSAELDIDLLIAEVTADLAQEGIV